MVNKRSILIDNIPTLIWGPDSDKIYIYVHGKMSCKENAERLAEIAISKGYQVISFDLPEHGERQMKKLISNMMKWFNITEDDLRKENSIPTPVGETLYWDYWIYTKENPIDKWTVDTYIFYPSKDSLTERSTIDEFISDHSAKLTVLDGAEHYFTDSKSLEKLEIWLQINI